MGFAAGPSVKFDPNLLFGRNRLLSNDDLGYSTAPCSQVYSAAILRLSGSYNRKADGSI